MSLVVNYSTEKELEEDFEQYCNIALSNGFSKGTANVSSADMKKLRGLLSYYRKKAHPFSSCVRDNRKRFGPLTEKYCAVLKDLIEGNTQWRNQKKKNLSEDTLKELYAIDIPDGFLHALSEWEIDENELQLADILWNPYKGLNYLREKLDAALNEEYQGHGDMAYEMMYWTHDINADDSTALVCHANQEYFVVPFTVDNSGDVQVAEESEWQEVEQAWVDANSTYLAETEVIAEVYLTDVSKEIEEKEGLIWKAIAKEGTWKYSPGPGQKPIAKPLTFVRSGKSNRKDLIVSIEELKNNFDSGAKQYVTVPISHENGILDNTGFVRQLKIEDSEDGKAVLKAGIEFTEPEIKEKIKRGTIADISSGIHFDYVKKDNGIKYNSILGHAALTNNPWLNGMTPFEVNAGEKVKIMAFSEEIELTEHGKKPYGDVKYADPGYQEDGVYRYPLDTEKHIRAAWGYINQKDNAAKYTSEQLKKIKAKIRAAMKEIGAEVDMSEEDNSQLQPPQGGDKVEVTEEKQEKEVEAPVQPMFLSELGISEDEAKARLAEYASLKAEQKRTRVDERCRKWQEEGVSPALVLAAKSILEADEGVAILNLSENGEEATLTATDIVDRLIAAAPQIKLTEDKVTDKDVEGQAPPTDAEDENEKAKVTLAERSLAHQLMFEAAMSEKEAFEEAKRRLTKNE